MNCPNFSEFEAILPKIVEEISAKILETPLEIKSDDIHAVLAQSAQNSVLISTEVTMTLLRKYHEWISQKKLRAFFMRSFAYSSDSGISTCRFRTAIVRAAISLGVPSIVIFTFITPSHIILAFIRHEEILEIGIGEKAFVDSVHLIS